MAEVARLTVRPHPTRPQRFIVIFAGETRELPVELSNAYLKDLKWVAGALKISGLSKYKSSNQGELAALISSRLQLSQKPETKETPIQLAPEKPASKKPETKNANTQNADTQNADAQLDSRWKNIPSDLIPSILSRLPTNNRIQFFDKYGLELPNLKKKTTKLLPPSPIRANHWVLKSGLDKYNIEEIIMDDKYAMKYLRKYKAQLLAELKEVSNGKAMWGDLISIESMDQYRNDGLFIFDGENILPLDSKLDDYGALPKQFTIWGISNMPIGYWHDEEYMDNNPDYRCIVHNIIVWVDLSIYVDELIHNIGINKFPQHTVVANKPELCSYFMRDGIKYILDTQELNINKLKTVLNKLKVKIPSAAEFFKGEELLMNFDPSPNVTYFRLF